MSKKDVTEYQSLTMGNSVFSFGDVVRQAWNSLVYHHTLDLKWKRTKSKYVAPTKIYALNTYINKDWCRLNEDGKKKAIYTHLSKEANQYGFYLEGFNYKESNSGAVSVYNITWAEEE